MTRRLVFIKHRKAHKWIPGLCLWHEVDCTDPGIPVGVDGGVLDKVVDCTDPDIPVGVERGVLDWVVDCRDVTGDCDTEI